jgi:DNA invertase Pin-like site-specific DNA recombinase
MQELMFQMLGAFAQFERTLIKERQKEGIDLAKAQGRKLGAPSKLTTTQIIEIRHYLALNNDKSQTAKHFGISRPTLYKIIAQEAVQG